MVRMIWYFGRKLYNKRWWDDKIDLDILEENYINIIDNEGINRLILDIFVAMVKFIFLKVIYDDI